MKDISIRTDPVEQLARYPLLDALINRRSRRFGRGMRLPNPPLAFESAFPPRPLSIEEEAALAFAACGITGHTLLELPYQPSQEREASGGNIITHLVGRTVASGDAIHTNIVFVINDQGVWMLRRPQDYPRTAIAELLTAAREHRLVDLYEKSRVKIADCRVDVPRELPFVPPFNRWSSNRPGTTCFLPVIELSALYINVLLSAFGEEFASFIVDDRCRFQPAGLASFARSRGGYLQDDPAQGRVGTISHTESWLNEFTAVEQGGILQNLALMAEALGVGGFPYFAAYPFIWPQTLGFRMEQIPFSRTIGAGPLLKFALKATRRDLPVPTPVGLERNGEVLIKPFCPPYYRSMTEAVRAYVDYKYAQGSGTLRDGAPASGWRDGASIQSQIPAYSHQAINATIAYCEYVYRRYGRFPSNSGPFRTVLLYQAHCLDPAFYERFYHSDALTETQRQQR